MCTPLGPSKHNSQFRPTFRHFASDKPWKWKKTNVFAGLMNIYRATLCQRSICCRRVSVRLFRCHKTAKCIGSHSRPLHVAYVDLKSAFDSVDRKASWKALRSVGVLQVVMKFIEDLHTDTTSRIRFGSMMSDIFFASSGVRHGCTLAPALFMPCNWLDHGANG